MTEPQDDAMAALLEKVPDALKPVAIQYGPALLKMSIEELWAWIALLIRGKKQEAYLAVLEKMDSVELLHEWDGLNERWDAANAENRAMKELQTAALNALLQALLVIVVGLLGM